MDDTTGRGWNLWSLAELEAMPDISPGWNAGLKVETEIDGTPVRVWLARTGVADGEPYDNHVTVEALQGGRWETVAEYQATDPDGDGWRE